VELQQKVLHSPEALAVNNSLKAIHKQTHFKVVTLIYKVLSTQRHA